MCYKAECKEPCDDFKKMYCIMRITKEQRDFMMQVLDREYCEICGQAKVKAKYKDFEIDLCTSCGVLRKLKGEVS